VNEGVTFFYRNRAWFDDGPATGLHRPSLGLTQQASRSQEKGKVFMLLGVAVVIKDIDGAVRMHCRHHASIPSTDELGRIQDYEAYQVRK
jgi:hypothetical protein